MALANGSRIEALPGSNERTIRGFSGVDLLIVDEASRVADELYYAVRPMLAVSGGALMMLSTPSGKRGVFYEAWTGQQTDEEWERYRITADQCPRIGSGFLADERRAMPPWLYRQEYECSFEETLDTVFPEELIQRIVRDDIQPLFPGGTRW